MRFYFTLSFFIFALAALSAQPQESAQMEVGRLRINISQNGSLGSDTLPFLEYRLEDGSYVSLLQQGGFQAGFQDPGGGLIAANFDGTVNAAGRQEAPTQLRGVYHVTKAQIEAHAADYADNQMIDDTIPAIFAWPGVGNPYFEAYSGDDFPLNELQGHAGFYDSDSDGLYNPASGDTPFLFTRGFGEACGQFEVPTEMFWLNFHQTPTDFSPALFRGEYEMTIASYGCAAAEAGAFENRSFVVHSKIIYLGEEKQDPAYLGFNFRAALGAAGNDALATDTLRELTYFYSSTETDAAFGDETVPVVGVFGVRGPLTQEFQLTRLRHALPLYEYQNGSPVFEPAENPAEFWNTLQSRWRDGTPLTTGGNGYQTGESTNFPFTGTPGNSEEWTFADVVDPPNRVGISASYEPVTYFPGAVNEQTLIISVNATGEDRAARIDSLRNDFSRVEGYQSGSSLCRVYQDCAELPSGFFAQESAYQTFSVYPNPSGNSTALRFDFGEAIRPDITQVQVVDLLGRPVSTAALNADGALEIGRLPKGTYVILLGSKSGEWYRARFVR